MKSLCAARKIQVKKKSENSPNTQVFFMPPPSTGMPSLLKGTESDPSSAPERSTFTINLDEEVCQSTRGKPENRIEV